jgi:hypothetical protein
MKIYFINSCLFITLLASSCKAQQQNVDAKIWSKDEAKVVHYSDWKSFAVNTISDIKAFKQTTNEATDKFGGLENTNHKSTGFFRTEKIDNRWFVINPLGNEFIVAAVNGLRQGKSPNNLTAFQNKFSTIENWMNESKKMFDENGFNVAGSWSDVAAIIAYNKTAAKPIVYCTQLSVLGAYKKYITKQNPERKGESELSFIMDEGFKPFCDKELQKISLSINDENLLGHFSDNEIPFTHNEFNDLLKEKNSFLLNWLKEKNIDEANITTENKKEFIGVVAEKYFSTVAPLIKKYDPNHLYIGSRLHSNAKANPFIFKAAEPFVDIVSINYYGNWQIQAKEFIDWANWTTKPFFITEFYTKAAETGMANLSGAGWIVKTHKDRGIHYQNFCLELLKAKNCVGWHWFRYQDNDPNDKSADASNNDSNKGIVNTEYNNYDELLKWMKELNINKYKLIKYFDKLN